MRIKNINDFGVSQGLLKEGKKGVDFLLPVFKRFLNYLEVPWNDECCGDTGTSVGQSLSIPEENYDSNAEALAALGVGQLYKSTTLINGSPIILITI